MIWILVAHRSSARLFHTTGKRGEIRLIREFLYPEGRRQNRELDTDAKGSHYSRTGRGSPQPGGAPSRQMKHGFDPQTEAAEHFADVFAKQLAEILHQGRTHQSFDEVLLVAEAGFLGRIRHFIDGPTLKMVSGSLNLNLAELPVRDLASHLEELVHESRRVA